MSGLFLIPSPISEGDELNISNSVREQIYPLRNFVVENLRTARRILRKYKYTADFDSEVSFFIWDKRKLSEDFTGIQKWMQDKKEIGLMSEAGLPCIADPGNEIVQLAHKYNYSVVPLTGSSSILMALVASGFNGQNFAFNGYLPIDRSERSKKLSKLESRLQSEGQTQIFMEAPYRNIAMLESILTACSSNTALCIASNIGGQNASIRTKKISEWKKEPLPNIHKVPVVFSLGII